LLWMTSSSCPPWPVCIDCTVQPCLRLVQVPCLWIGLQQLEPRNIQYSTENLDRHNGAMASNHREDDGGGGVASEAVGEMQPTTDSPPQNDDCGQEEGQGDDDTAGHQTTTQKQDDGSSKQVVDTSAGDDIHTNVASAANSRPRQPTTTTKGKVEEKEEGVATVSKSSPEKKRKREDATTTIPPEEEDSTTISESPKKSSQKSADASTHGRNKNEIVVKTTKVDGRKKNKGAFERESYSIAFKANVVLDFLAWETAQKATGDPATVREYVTVRTLDKKYEKFLSTNAWRSPKNMKRIMEYEAGAAEHQRLLSTANSDATVVGSGRNNCRGAPKRQSYSVAFKAKVLHDYNAWEEAQRKAGKPTTIRDYVTLQKMDKKFEKYLSTGGWRAPATQQRIMEDALRDEYKDMAKMHDRTKNKSCYAAMEVALVQRIEECRHRHQVITNATVKEMAREELRRLTNNDEEKVNGFKASAGWLAHFLQRQKRKASDEQWQQRKKKKKKQQPASCLKGGDSSSGPEEEESEEEEALAAGPNAPSEEEESVAIDCQKAMENSDDEGEVI
jgi:Tc5 transposase DNA-binding domain